MRSCQAKEMTKMQLVRLRDIMAAILVEIVKICMYIKENKTLWWNKK